MREYCGAPDSAPGRRLNTCILSKSHDSTIQHRAIDGRRWSTPNTEGTIMATKYDMFNGVDEQKTYARKDAAIKAGEKLGKPFQVLANPSGTVVYTSPEAAPAAPAKPTKEKTVTKTATKPATKPAEDDVVGAAPAKPAKAKDGTPLEFNHGAKYFFREMGAGAIRVAEDAGLEAELDNPSRSIVVSGGTAKQRQQAIKKMDAFLTAEYEAFKAWKREGREQRKTWYETPEGRKAMTEAETAFFDKFTENYLAGADVI